MGGMDLTEVRMNNIRIVVNLARQFLSEEQVTRKKFLDNKQ
jgi:hypothetical protein